MLSMARNVRLSPGTYAFDATGFTEKAGGYNYNSQVDVNGKVTLTYASGKGYPEARFSFPDGIELNSLKSITLNGVSCSAGSVFLKLLDANGNQLKTNWGSTVALTPYETAGLSNNQIAITYNGTVSNDADAVVEVESITLEFYDVKYCNKTYTLAQHTVFGSPSGYNQETGELTYQAQNDEIKFYLPDFVKNNYKQLQNVHFNIESLSAPAGAGDTENVAYKVYQTDISNWQNAIEGTKYTASTSVDYEINQSKITDTTTGLVGIGICDNYSTAGELKLKVKDVTYTLIDDGNLTEEPTGTYTITVYPSKLTEAWKNATSNEMGADNRWHMEFGAANKEVCFNLPSKINMAECESITFNVKDQVEILNFAIALSGTKKGNWYYNTGKTSYELTGDTTYEVTNGGQSAYSGEIDAVHLQQNDQSKAGASVTLDSIIFTMKKTADQQDVVYGGDKPPIDEPVDPAGNTTPAGDGVDDISLPATAENMTFIPATADGTVKSNNGVTAGDPNEQGTRQLHMDASYNACIFELTEGIDLSQCTKATFAIPSLTNSMILRLYTQEDIDNRGDKNWWDCYTAVEWSVSNKLQEIDLSGKEGTLKYISIASGASTDADCMFDGVLFEMEGQEEPVETYTVTVNASALDVDGANAWTANVTSVKRTDDNRLEIVFSSAAYSQARIPLPDMSDLFADGKIDVADCVDITFNVKAQDGPVNFKAWLGENACGTWNYNSGKTAYTRKPSEMVKDDQSAANYSGKMDAIGVQIAGDTGDGDSIILDSIVFTMKKTADQQDKVYGEPPTDEPIDITVNVTPELQARMTEGSPSKTEGLWHCPVRM